MYIIKKKLAIIAILVALLSTVFCPFLKVILVGSWNLYKVDSYLFYITVGILLVLLLFMILNQPRVFRIISLFFIAWVLIALSAVYFKINNYFGMSLADSVLSNGLKMTWGWVVLITMSFVIYLSVRKVESKNISVHED